MAHFIKIILELAAQHLCVSQSDSRDSQAVHHPGKGGIGRCLYGCNQIVIRLLAQTLHFHDCIPVFFQMEYIRIFVNKTCLDEFFQGGLRQTVNVKCIAADKEGKALYLFGLAVRIGAVQALYIIYLADFRPASTYGTFLRYVLYPAAGQVFLYLRDNHVGLIHGYGISHSQLQPFHDAQIVDTGPADRGSF